jgi:phosphate starvation-inducible membrane PsiE
MTDAPRSPLPTRLQAVDRSIGLVSDAMGNLFVNVFHKLALFGIGAATVWAAVRAFMAMIAKGGAGIEDLLLLFIYLEIGAMVGIYFKTNHMPVRFLLYVGITAVTRHLIDIVNVAPELNWPVLMLAGAILLLAIAVVVLRYASFHYPMDAPSKSGSGFSGESD